MLKLLLVARETVTEGAILEEYWSSIGGVILELYWSSIGGAILEG